MAKNSQGFRGRGAVTIKESDILPIVRGELKRIRREAQRGATASSNTIRRYHLQDIVERIDAMLDPK